MIIPISTQDIKIDDIVINIKLIDFIYYIIPPGHEFKIIDYNKNYDYFVGEDLIYNQQVKLRATEITKKVSLKKAENEYIYKIETSKYKEHIRKFCPNADYDYEDRCEYESCTLIKSGWNKCYPKIECAKYLTKDNINKSKELVKHLRLNKINKINKT